MSFENFGLQAELVRAVVEMGYTQPTPIQTRGIPAVLEGRDLLAAAQTGTGKTAAFALPLLQKLHEDQPNPRGSRAPRALVLVPTRELAAQVQQSIADLGTHLRQQSALIFGGVSPRPQIDLLRRGVDIVVATPGRLLDHANERNIDLRSVRYLILDEADRMLDMGFIRDIRRVLAMLPPNRQNLLFSATFSEDIRGLANGLLRNPLTIEVAPRNAPTELVDHRVHLVSQGEKRAVLSHLLKSGATPQTLVFTRTKHGANRLAEQLTHDGVQCAAIHGNKSQSARTRALEDFKAYKVQVLVATDIAARGLDITELPQVVNYELPHVPEDYVHRIGRTGRAGATGQALSLVSDDERDRLKAIERVLGRKISVLPLDRTQIPRPSGEGKAREPRHVDPRAQQQRYAKPQGQARHRQGSGQGQGASQGGQAQGGGAHAAHGRPGGAGSGGARRPRARSFGSQA